MYNVKMFSFKIFISIKDVDRVPTLPNNLLEKNKKRESQLLI